MSPIVLLRASVISVWAFITTSSLQLHQIAFPEAYVGLVTYVAFPSEVLVGFMTDERSNSSRFDDVFESMARFEASRAARMSLFSLVIDLGTDSN